MKDEKKKILIATNHSYMLWQFRRELITELQKFGDVIISTPFVGHENDMKNIGCRTIETQITRRGINPIKDMKLYRFYKALIKAEKPDMVITYSIKPNIYAGFACSRLKVPYYVNIQGLGSAFQREPIASVAKIMYKTAIKKAKAVFFENTANAEAFIKMGVLKKEQATVLHGAGVNLDYYAFQDYPDEKNGIRFLYLGRIMKEKGIGELLGAVEKAKAKYGDRVIFDIVGFFEDEYKEQVEKFVAEGKVNFYGFQTDPNPFYKRSHCVILPSYHEGMSNVLLEASSAGRPLITTDIPGCREAVEDEKNGFLCRKADVDSLFECIEKFLMLDENKRRNMGKIGRKKAESEFDKKAVVKETVNVLFKNN